MKKIGLGIGALLCAAAAAAWWTLPKRSIFYTDADSIRQSPEQAQLRDVLWRPPRRLDGAINGGGDEVEPRMDASGGVMYFARRGTAGDCDLYAVRRDGERWGRPEPLVGLNTLDNELGPTPSPDGRWLYFASDRPGGLGGFDLWRAARIDDAWGEPERLGESINSAANEAWAAISADGRRLAFASDRSGESAAESDSGEETGDVSGAGGYDLYEAPIDPAGALGAPERIDDACSSGDDVAPAFSPVGDFLYFASDRAEGRGGFDLYRARLVDGNVTSIEPLGAEVNTGADEMDPTLSMGGFELHFSSNRQSPRGPVEESVSSLTDEADAPTYDLFETTSREVFLGEEVRRNDLAALLGLLPWILAVLALILLLSLLRRVSNEAWRVRWGTLSLMAKCVLFSLLVHAALLALLSLWQVRPEPGERVAGTEVGVSLTSRALSAAVESQMRGGLGEVAIEPVGEAPSAPMETDARTLEQREMRAEVSPEASSVSESRVAMTQTERAVESPAAASQATPMRVEVSAPSEAATRRRQPDVATPRERSPSAARGAEAPVAVEASTDTLESVVSPRPLGQGAAPGAIQLDVGQTPIADSVSTLASAGAAVEDAAAPTRSATRPLTTPRASARVSGRGALDVALPDVSSAAGERAPSVVEAPMGDLSAESPDVASPRAPVMIGDSGSGRVFESNPGASTVGGIPDEPLDAGAPLESAPVDTGSVGAVSPRRSAAPERAGAFEVALPTVREREPEPVSRLRITGLVLDKESREPIAGATVRLDIEGRDPLMIESDSQGAFSLAPERVPDHSAVTASRRGYLPAAMNVSERDFERGAEVVLLLEKLNPFVIALEERPEVHHLGNDEFTGRVNSQFQRRSEGTRLVMRFELDRSVVRRASRAHLELMAKGVQLNNPVFVNGRRLRRTLPASPSDGSFDRVRLLVPLGWLVEGMNELEFRSVRSPTTDVDDYEFVNVRVVLEPTEVGL